MHFENAIGWMSISKEMLDESLQMLRKFPAGQTVDDIVNQRIRNIDDNLYELINWLTPMVAGEDE